MPFFRATAAAALFVASVLAPPLAWSQAASKAAPARPDPIRDFIMLKDSEALNGDVKTDKYVLKTKYGDIALKKTDILAIMFMRPIETVSEATRKALGRK